LSKVATLLLYVQLQPVGEVAHFQICGYGQSVGMTRAVTEDLIEICKDRIASKGDQIQRQTACFQSIGRSRNCLGPCSNAPCADGKGLLRRPCTRRRRSPRPCIGRQGRRAGSCAGGRDTARTPCGHPVRGLGHAATDHDSGRHNINASAHAGGDIGDTINAFDATEVP